MKPAVRLPALLVLIAAALLAGAGCSKPVLRQAQVAAGDYYSEDEYNRLTPAQREQYCTDLAAELERLVAGKANAAPSGREAEIARLKADLGRLRQQLLGDTADLTTLRAEIAWFEALPDSYRVEPGDYLMRIAAEEQIYADPRKWSRLERANRARIRHADRIWPGQVLVVPRDWPRQHEVAAGEWLSKIAGYWEVYDDALAWPRLYEANRDRIADPALIRPGQVLAIPR